MSVQRTASLIHFIAKFTCRPSQSTHFRVQRPLQSQPPTALRRFATAAREPGTSKAQAILVNVPRKEALYDDEDVNLLSRDEAQIQITERAAEVRVIGQSCNHKSSFVRFAFFRSFALYH